MKLSVVRFSPLGPLAPCKTRLETPPIKITASRLNVPAGSCSVVLLPTRAFKAVAVICAAVTLTTVVFTIEEAAPAVLSAAGTVNSGVVIFCPFQMLSSLCILVL